MSTVDANSIARALVVIRTVLSEDAACRATGSPEMYVVDLIGEPGVSPAVPTIRYSVDSGEMDNVNMLVRTIDSLCVPRMVVYPSVFTCQKHSKASVRSTCHLMQVKGD